MPWATIEQVKTYTDVTVTMGQLLMAQGVIDLYSGLSEATLDPQRVTLRNRDKTLLTQAVAYQAAWMSAQIDPFTRADLASLNQDGVSFTTAHADAQQLAPLSKRAIERLTWMQSRSRSSTMEDRNRNNIQAFLTDNDNGEWKPL